LIPHEVAAILLFGLGVLLFLALVSFDTGDVYFFKNPPNDPVVNYIGPVGAYTAGLLFFLFGFASYGLPVALFGMAFLVGFKPGFNVWLKLGLGALFLITGAALLQLAPIPKDWHLNPIQSDLSQRGMPGGWAGYLLNDKFVASALGNLGAAISFGVTYISCFVFLFEFNPIDLTRRGVEWAQDWYERYMEEKLRNADPIERIAYEKKKLERERKEIQKRLSKVEPKIKEPDEKRRPKPKIVDTTATSQEHKETVEEVKSVGLPKVEKIIEEIKPAPIPKPKPVIRSASASPSAEEKKVPAPSYENYQLPNVDLLTANDGDSKVVLDEEELRANQQLLMDTLRHFDIETSPGDITRGATITRYEVFPADGVRVERIVNLQKDIARAMKAERVNILAPIPGKDTVGIEIANSQKSKIVLRDLVETSDWKVSRARLPIALGKDVYGRVIVDDLAEMPHLLIAGTTGSGKSVCINCLILSLLYRFSPEDLRIILVDPKVVELQVYNNLPHLVVPVVTDPKKVLVTLRWVIVEMENRYRMMAKAGVRNVAAYNVKMQDRKKARSEQLGLGGLDSGEPQPRHSLDDPELPEHFPYVVVIVDELADLMQTTPADVENAIARLCAKARAAGIHLVIATQTPRASVITGVIKTNVPARIAFQVPSALDSRVILDENGAENLLGKGDLLYLRPGSAKLIRAQGAYVSEEEVNHVVEFICKQAPAAYASEIHEKLSKDGSDEDEEVSEKDEEMIDKCLEVIRQEKRASTSLLQRRLKIGYNTAARVMDILEQRGVVGPKDGSRDREILKNLDDDLSMASDALKEYDEDE
jgi:S-DNA-T family DNA segregation ATPase FtsK/SpoIIIE